MERKTSRTRSCRRFFPWKPTTTGYDERTRDMLHNDCIAFKTQAHLFKFLKVVHVNFPKTLRPKVCLRNHSRWRFLGCRVLKTHVGKPSTPKALRLRHPSCRVSIRLQTLQPPTATEDTQPCHLWTEVSFLKVLILLGPFCQSWDAPTTRRKKMVREKRLRFIDLGAMTSSAELKRLQKLASEISSIEGSAIKAPFFQRRE